MLLKKRHRIQRHRINRRKVHFQRHSTNQGKEAAAFVGVKWNDPDWAENSIKIVT
jgi:hypothetical protein